MLVLVLECTSCSCSIARARPVALVLVPDGFVLARARASWVGRSGLCTEHEKGPVFFFVFSPKCRSVSVGFENETEKNRNHHRTLLGQFLGETS